MTKNQAEDLMDAMQMSHQRGYVYGKCDSCGIEQKLEPDAVIDCPKKSCDGTISSPIREAGLI